MTRDIKSIELLAPNPFKLWVFSILFGSTVLVVVGSISSQDLATLLVWPLMVLVATIFSFWVPLLFKLLFASVFPIQSKSKAVQLFALYTTAPVLVAMAALHHWSDGAVWWLLVFHAITLIKFVWSLKPVE